MQMQKLVVENLIVHRCISLNTTRIEDITETAVIMFKLSKDLTEIFKVRHGMCEPQICDKIVCDDFIYPVTVSTF